MAPRQNRSLTTPEVGDPTAVPDLLTQMVTPFETFMGDGAYDGEAVLRAVLEPSIQRSGGRSTAQDGHLFSRWRYAARPPYPGHCATGPPRLAEDHGLYNLRNYAELALQRYKRIFGNTMKARALPQQKTEAWISVSARHCQL